jgi:O-antigen ligase
MLLMVPVLASVFTVAVGWERVWDRFHQAEPYLNRKEFMLAALDMAKHRPLTGYGLGTFPEVYLRYATRDFPLYVNHAHNDWAEIAAEGGFLFLLLVLIPFAVVVPTAVRNPWGLGLITIMVNACVDFPFFHPGVPGWIFMLLALLYTSRMPDETGPEKVKRTSSNGAPALDSISTRRRVTGVLRRGFRRGEIAQEYPKQAESQPEGYEQDQHALDAL